MSTTAPIRVRLRYAAFDTFIEKFAPNVTRGGVFLASRTPPPVGTTFAFEIQLAGGEVALAGDGKVIWVKPYDPAAPQKAHGMGVQFLRLDEPSRQTAQPDAGAQGERPGVGRRPHAPIPERRLGPDRERHATAAAGAARIDTSVDLAAEFGIDDARLRRAVDRSKLPPNRAAIGSRAGGLLRGEPAEPVSLTQALARCHACSTPGPPDDRRLPPARRALRPLRSLARSTDGRAPWAPPIAPEQPSQRGPTTGSGAARLSVAGRMRADVRPDAVERDVALPCTTQREDAAGPPAELASPRRTASRRHGAGVRHRP